METLIEFLKLGNKFTFPKSPLIKKAEEMLSRDLRKNLVNNSTKGYIKRVRIPNRIRRGQTGLKLISYQDIIRLNDLDYSGNIDYNINVDIPEDDVDKYGLYFLQQSDPVLEHMQQLETLYIDHPKLPLKTKKYKKPMEPVDYNKHKGFAEFDKLYSEVEQEMPEAKKYREVLTKLAKHESGFNSYILNKAGAPAYGYFLFMLDGLKWNNITKYSGLSIDEFRESPKDQIRAAVRLASTFEKSFTLEDIEKANNKGITISGLIGGAWLAGPGGVRKFLNGEGDPSDKHWSKDGKTGSSVSQAVKRYN